MASSQYFPPQAFAATAPVAVRPDMLQRVGFGILSAYLFLLWSRVVEFGGLNQLSLLFILGLAAIVISVMTGGLQAALRSKWGVLLTLFTVWLLLSTLVSTWKRGSVTLLSDYWIKSLMAYLAIAGSIFTVAQSRRSAYIAALGLVSVQALSLVIGGEDVTGRMGLEKGTFGNANGLSFHTIVLFPFAMFLIFRAGNFWKLLSAAAIVVGIFTVMRTGSRSGLIEIAVFSGLLFFRLALTQKAVFAAVMTGVLAIGVGLVSDKAWERYKTMFSSDVTSAEYASAAASQDQRLYVLQQSLMMTFENPLFGVGPGVFLAALATEEQKAGQNAGWISTHNAYTQLSSEAGIPALLLYLYMMWVSVKINFSMYRANRRIPGRETIADLSYCLFMSLILFAVNAPFDNNAYQYYFPALAGLTMAFSAAVAREAPGRITQPVSVRPAAGVPAPPMAKVAAGLPGLKMTRYSIPGSGRRSGI
jgi:O-antigen ligase